MYKLQNLFVPIIYVLLLVLFSTTITIGQSIPNYLFLQVVDSENKPIQDATVKTNFKLSKDSKKTQFKTSNNGNARFLLPHFNYLRNSLFEITKSGYFTYQDLGVQILPNSYNTTVKLELLKIPQNENEKETLGNEQSKREFMLAAKNGDYKTVRKFLKKNINPNLNTNDLRGISAPKGIPAIVLAATSGNGKTVKMLLKAGANVKIPQEILAVYLNSESFIKRYEKADKKERVKLLREYESGFESLLKAGANTKNLYGGASTALRIAARRGYVGIVETLLKKGADVEGFSDNKGYGHTALFYVVKYEDSKPLFPPVEVVKALLKAGADPNIVTSPYTEYCESILMAAVWRSNTEILKLLVKYKANPMYKCRNGNSAFSYKYLYKLSDPKVQKLLDILRDAGTEN